MWNYPWSLILFYLLEQHEQSQLFDISQVILHTKIYIIAYININFQH